MPGFQQKSSYDFLRGTEITQIQINKYTVCFVFEAGRDADNYFDITVNTVFEHYNAADGSTSKYDVQGATKDFTEYALLEVPVTGTEIVSDDQLKVTFQNRDALTLIRRDDGHESMTINTPKGVIVID